MLEINPNTVVITLNVKKRYKWSNLVKEKESRKIESLS